VSVQALLGMKQESGWRLCNIKRDGKGKGIQQRWTLRGMPGRRYKAVAMHSYDCDHGVGVDETWVVYCVTPFSGSTISRGLCLLCEGEAVCKLANEESVADRHRLSPAARARID